MYNVHMLKDLKQPKLQEVHHEYTTVCLNPLSLLHKQLNLQKNTESTEVNTNCTIMYITCSKRVDYASNQHLINVRTNEENIIQNLFCFIKAGAGPLHRLRLRQKSTGSATLLLKQEKSFKIQTQKNFAIKLIVTKFSVDNAL